MTHLDSLVRGIPELDVPMRALMLGALLVAGCTAGPGTTAPSGAPATSPPPTTATAAAPTPEATAPPTTTPEPNTIYTAEDEEIAAMITAGSDEAIAQLKLLNGMDPGKLEDLFLPLEAWIAGETSAIEASTPSSCTAAAVELYIDGLDAYDDIRVTFMGWRDWGAQGRPFSRGAPPQAVAIFEEALTELEAHCPPP